MGIINIGKRIIPATYEPPPAPSFEMGDIAWDHWYEASDTDNFLLSGNDVTTWYDLGSVGTNLGAGFAEGFDGGGSVQVNQHTINGLNVVTVLNGWFQSPQVTVDNPWSGVVSGDVFMVVKNSASGALGYPWFSFGEGDNNSFRGHVEQLLWLGCDYNSPSYPKLGHDATPDEGSGSTNVASEATRLVHLHSSGSAWTVTLSGGSAESLSWSAGSNTGNWLDDFTVSSAYRWSFALGAWCVVAIMPLDSLDGFSGYFCEFAVKHGALSSGDISDVTSFLKTKWGIS